MQSRWDFIKNIYLKNIIIIQNVWQKVYIFAYAVNIYR